MTEKVRVLYAEDSPHDADLTKTHFEINVPDIDLEVVETGQRCLARHLAPILGSHACSD